MSLVSSIFKEVAYHTYMFTSSTIASLESTKVSTPSTLAVEGAFGHPPEGSWHAGSEKPRLGESQAH